MYRIQLLDQTGQTSELHNSDPYSINRKVVSPVLEMEVNRAGSLEFDIYPNHALYDLILNPLNEYTVIETYDGTDTEIWRGRLYSSERGFQNNQHIILEGELAYLRDICQEPKEYESVDPKTYATGLLKVYNSKAAVNRKFVLGRVTVTDDHSSDKITKRVNKGSYSTSYSDNTLDCLVRLAENLGGHLEIRRENGVRYLDILKDYEHTCSQVIRFGRNLLNFTSNYSLADLVTCLVPIGGSVETTDPTTGDTVTQNITVASVNNNSPYVLSSTAIASYGRREGTITFSGIIEPANLLALGKKWLSDQQFDNMVLAINAVDAAYFADSEEPLRFLYRVRAVSDPHGMDKFFPITKVSLTLDDPSNCLYTMSTTTKPTTSMSTQITDHDKETQQYLSDLENDINDVASRFAKYTSTAAGEPSDWLFGECYVFYPTDEKKIDLLKHNEYLIAAYEPNNDYVHQEQLSFPSHEQKIKCTVGWKNILATDEVTGTATVCGETIKLTDGEILIRDVYPDRELPEPWVAGIGAVDDGGEYPCFGFTNRVIGQLPVNVHNDETWVVYVVIRITADTLAKFGRTADYYFAGTNMALTTDSGNLALQTAYNTRVPTWVTGSGQPYAMPIADTWVACAMCNNVADGEEYTAKGFALGLSGGSVIFPQESYPSTIGQGYRFGINYAIEQLDDKDAPDNCESAYRFIAVENAVYGQITMDEVVENLQSAVTRYVDVVLGGE